MNKLIVLIAPSGAGKDTLADLIFADFPEIKRLITYTTRQPRVGEQNAVDYYFVSEIEFKSMLENGELHEHYFFQDHYYGTGKKVLADTLKHGHAMTDMDIHGAEYFKKTFPELALLVFIAPPSLQALRDRLEKRGKNTEEEIQKRLKIADEEMEWSHNCDVVIVNDNLEIAHQELKNWLIKKL